MNNKETYILFIFEGKKTEPSIMNSLEKFFLNERKHLHIKAVYGTTIYTLYQRFLCFGIFDDDLDTFSLAQEFSGELSEIERDQVAEIYLFFDYDKQATNANDCALQDMLSRFNNETEQGKLYISYPMVEALKHINRQIDFKNVKADCNKGYKTLVESECCDSLKHLNRYNKDTWHFVITQHAMKANFIVNNKYIFPENIIEQLDVFYQQLATYNTDKQVYSLSAFPIFLLDYYGVNVFKDTKCEARVKDDLY